VRPLHLAALVVLSVIWGAAFMLVKVVLEEVEPLTLVAGRVIGAAIFLALVMAFTSKAYPRTGRAWFASVVLGLGNNVWPFVLLTWGQQHIESSLAAILTASMTLSVAVLAHFWIDERLTFDRTAGILVGFAGVFVLIGADLRDVTESSTLGQLAVIAGVQGYAFGTVFARRYLQAADGVETAAGQTLVAAAFMLPVALAAERPFDLDLAPKHAVAWVTLAVLASGVAYLLFFWVIRYVTATQAAMVSYLIPITAVFLGALVLEERLGVNSFVGLGLIVFGVWVVNGGGRWIGARAGPAQPVSGGADGD
jgi:drug/metabolite transporter (DMT)-like permease